MRASARSLLVLAVIAATCTQAGDVWRWKDAQGVVHYSDVPVQGAVRVKQNVANSSSSAGRAQGTAAAGQSAPVLTPEGTALADEQRQQQAAGKAVLQDIAKKRVEQCKAATAQYEQLITSRRIYREEKKGERTYLSDKELEETRVRVRQERDAVCGPASR
jgi:hypothetical protein